MSNADSIFIPENGRDFKLRPCYEFAKGTVTFPSLMSRELDSVRAAFARNILRQNAVLLMILTTIQHAAQMERCRAIAEFQIDGRWRVDMAVKEPSLAVYSKSVENFKQSAPSSGKDLDDETIEYQFDDMFDRWEMASKSSVAFIQLGTDGLLASQLLGAWTAFETMAADLWETALNVHPATLAALKGDSKRILKSSDGMRLPEDRKRNVPIHFLEMHNYDVASRMGSILRQKQEFDSLGEFVKLTEWLFPRKPTQLIRH